MSNYTFDEYLKMTSLSGYMAGVLLGYVKYFDISKQDQKHLAAQLLWCYEKSGVPVPEGVMEDIRKLLS